jgi:tyrosinase
MRVAVFILLLCIILSGIAQATSVRRSIFALDPNGPEIASLRRGIQVMKSRPSTDPTSWIYQANMHGTDDQPVQPAWNGCQHGSFYFFPWHRIYLYYFERILRAASGDPTLALPYWNYTDDANKPDPDRRQLPVAFRQPADASNPLFVSQRNSAMNDGTGFLNPASVEYSRAFNLTNFEAPVGSGAASFGGPTRSNHSTGTDDFGALESTPHNAVHGGVGGWMNDPNLSARDPIFYLHHANIDRLWKRWLAQGGGRQDPTGDQVWMNTMFTFFDENGQQVQKSGKDILDTVGQLNYCYDDDPGCAPHKDLTPIYYLLLDEGFNKDLTPIYYLLKSDE